MEHVYAYNTHISCLMRGLYLYLNWCKIREFLIKRISNTWKILRTNRVAELRPLDVPPYPLKQTNRGGCHRSFDGETTTTLGISGNIFALKRRNTVDGSEIRRLPVDMVKYHIIYSFLYIPGGCLEFLNHQQYQPEKPIHC